MQDPETYDNYIVGLTAARLLAGEAPVLTGEERTHIEVCAFPARLSDVILASFLSIQTITLVAGTGEVVMDIHASRGSVAGTVDR